MRILYVCTANICRSASAQQLLREAVAGAPELAGIEVRSAGTAAMAGLTGCLMAPALAGHASEHQSQPLTAELVSWADLILAAARDHRPPIVELEQAARRRLFTIRQAGRIADWLLDSGMVAAGRERSEWAAEGSNEGAHGTVGVTSAHVEGTAAWADRFPLGDPRRDVEALPDDPVGRGLWIVNEMDAARGWTSALRSAEAAPVVTARRFRFGRRGWSQGVPGGAAPTMSSAVPGSADADQADQDSVPDPHLLGMGLHPLAYEQIKSSTDALVRLLREAAAAG